MKLIAGFFLLISSFFLLHPNPAFAHAGGGPPFLLINGKYAQTNPFFLGGPDVPVSQDTSPELYLPNIPIQFELDISQLQVPKSIATTSTFRWTWEENSQTHEYGTKFSHTYSKIGSYLMILEVKGPQEADYVVLDTVQINIVPSLTYNLPTADIVMYPNDLKQNVPITFKAVATTDLSAQPAVADWYADGSKTGHAAEFTHTYTDAQFADYVFLKVTDGNGIGADAAIQVAGDNGKLAVSNLNPKSATVSLIKSGQPSTRATPSRSAFLLLLGVGVVCVVIVYSGIVTIKRRKGK